MLPKVVSLTVDSGTLKFRTFSSIDRHIFLIVRGTDYLVQRSYNLFLLAFALNLYTEHTGRNDQQFNDGAEEWESQRQNFKRLYVTEDKPLGNVADAMYKIYGFQATYVITFRKPTRLFLLLRFKMSLCSIRFLDPNFTLCHNRWHVISSNISFKGNASTNERLQNGISTRMSKMKR